MSFVPSDFEQRVADAVATLRAAAEDPNNESNMKVAAARYARAKEMFATVPLGGELEPDLNKMSAAKQHLEAAAEELRRSLRLHGLDASVI